MDGVLVDFVKGAEKQTGKSITKWAQGRKSEKWGQIKATPNFWRDLPWMSGGKQLWNFLKNKDVEILSAYVEDTYDKNFIPGKRFWATKNLGISSSKINLVRREQKQQLADKTVEELREMLNLQIESMDKKDVMNLLVRSRGKFGVEITEE